MRRIVAAFLVALALGGAAPAHAADPVTAVATIDTATITLGDRISLAVVVDADNGYQVTEPTIAHDLGAFEVLQTLPTRKTTAAARQRWTYRYLITSWTLGKLTVPGIEIGYVGPDGERGTVRTAELAVTAVSVRQPGESATDIKPIKPQLELPGALVSRFLRAATGVGAAVALAALSALVFWLILRRRRRAEEEEHLTPVQRALRELDELAAARLPEQGRTEEHYAKLITTLRRYAVDRYQVDPGRTSREMRLALERAGLERTQAAAIYEILREGDEVRFRHQVPYPSHAQNTVRAALDLVRRAATAEEYETAALQPQ